MAKNRWIDMLIAGRTLDEQAEYVRRYGSHTELPMLRQMLLSSLGIGLPKPTSENVVVFGCLIPYGSPQLILDYLKLLDFLQIDYTYLEKEYCCGAPLVYSAISDEKDQAIVVSREFLQMNHDLALQKGATTIAYLCTGCAHNAKSILPTKIADSHKYYFELLFNRIEQVNLKIDPQKMGYFEGCKITYRKQCPDAEIDWNRCRSLLSRIDGLTTVDLPNKPCCSVNPKGIVESAQQQGLDTILCSCNACYGNLRMVAQEKVKVKFLTELLLEATGAM